MLLSACRERAAVNGRGQRLANLATDLLLADDQRIQAAGHAHHVEQRVVARQDSQVRLQLGLIDAGGARQRAAQRSDRAGGSAVDPGVHLDAIARREQQRGEPVGREPPPGSFIHRHALADVQRRGVMAEANHDQARHQTGAPPS